MLTAVIMAKRPGPGRVKTRLVDDGALSAAAAADLARAMFVATATRLEAVATVVLALDEGPGDGPEDLGLGHLRVLAQGEGTLGARIERVWRAVGPGPVAFLGADAPDVPRAALEAIAPALDAHDAAVGPTRDGGYWVLAARAPQPALLRRIDWGTRSVYDQTCSRADEAGLDLAALPVWDDVDLPDDLLALRRRLATCDDPALELLRARIDDLAIPTPWNDSLT